jgi:DNA polymerase III subunit epsilon
MTEASAETAGRQTYLESPFPGRQVPWREASFSVVDLELTGLDPDADEIISFAGVTVRRGRIQLDDTAYELVRPNRMPNWDTIRIHGLREADLTDAPTLDERLDRLLGALTGSVLVAHVATIETGFLRAAFERRGFTLRNPVVDTAALALELSRLRREQPPSRSDSAPPGIAISTPGLGDLARWLGLPVHRPHEADGDALTTAQAFIALATHLEEFENPLTVGALQRMSTARPDDGASNLLGRLLGRLRR